MVGHGTIDLASPKNFIGISLGDRPERATRLFVLTNFSTPGESRLNWA